VWQLMHLGWVRTEYIWSQAAKPSAGAMRELVREGRGLGAACAIAVRLEGHASRRATAAIPQPCFRAFRTSVFMSGRELAIIARDTSNIVF